MMVTETDFDVKVHVGEESLADGCPVKKHQARSASATAATTSVLRGSAECGWLPNACFQMIAATAAGDPRRCRRAIYYAPLVELESIVTTMAA